ncbi:MAG: RIP metalloprotease RseP [Bacteroidales bacterium]|nr:RIP metalloprotease RseP [Bacteroidales bacterium]MDZ4203514.1 RIP metalloprotease RseP [Bacteroidales bacterium]
MEILIKALQLILSLAILVIFHELGHFIAAKTFKTRVESFYLFFNPWFSLFKYKHGETTYGIGWLPLGGYVKIAGMIDESLDREQMAKPPQPWEFRSKPAWQRLIIMVGGVSVNILLAFAIYISMLTVWGEEYLPASELKYGITVDSMAFEMGLRNGDHIISIDGKPVEDFFKIPSQIILNNATTVQVIRDEQPLEVVIPDGFVTRLLKHRSPEFIGVRTPFEVAGFTEGSSAQKAGLQTGDRIIGINQIYLPFFDQFKRELQQYKNQSVDVNLSRGSDTLQLTVLVSEAGTIGVYPIQNLDHYFTVKSKQYNLFQAIPAGIVKGYRGIGNYLKQLRIIFSPKTKAYESLGGFITIGSIFPSYWNWQAFWELTAFLSIMLAILNILPIPALDGGHVLFLLYEIVTRRKPGEKFMEYAQITGMILLLALVIFANTNDIRNLFR